MLATIAAFFERRLKPASNAVKPHAKLLLERVSSTLPTIPGTASLRKAAIPRMAAGASIIQAVDCDPFVRPALSVVSVDVTNSLIWKEPIIQWRR
jgi:hypothetical protein